LGDKAITSASGSARNTKQLWPKDWLSFYGWEILKLFNENFISPGIPGRFRFFFSGGGAGIEVVEIPSSPEAVDTAIGDEFSISTILQHWIKPKASFFLLLLLVFFLGFSISELKGIVVTTLITLHTTLITLHAQTVSFYCE
jgi:hypothetical protein